MIKLGLIKETKIPEDNRVLLTPTQAKLIVESYPNVQIVVESSKTRAFTDAEYLDKGINIVTDLLDCDVLLGIKEVALGTLIPNKHYFFFGHIAKMQSYNKPLIKELINKKITFSDYEYLIDNSGHRVCAFGWWAGFVGVYNSLRAYGLKFGLFNLKDALELENIKDLVAEVRMKTTNQALPTLVLTGDGKVTEGALYFVNELCYKECDIKEYLNSDKLSNRYLHLSLSDLVKPKDASETFNRLDFKLCPNSYESDFKRFYSKCDIFIPCHFWGSNDPVYVSESDLKDEAFNIKVIGDVTCDIAGGIKSTVRPSTHKEPFYDIDRYTLEEKPLFSSLENLTIMAVDTLPNALPRAASEYFGQKFIQNILPDLVNMYAKGELSRVICDATILKEGSLTSKYSYLTEYAKEK